MNNPSNDSNNFRSTINSLAYEKLTGQKFSGISSACLTPTSNSANRGSCASTSNSASRGSCVSTSNSASRGSCASTMNQSSGSGTISGDSSSNNGTSHWAAGMANAGDVLGNLGMGSSDIGMAESSTWDLPPHSIYGSPKQREMLSSNMVSNKTMNDILAF